MKPDIVFFGENLPSRFFMYQDDLHVCDLLVVMGTALEVYPFAGLVYETNPEVPRVLINRDVVGPFHRARRRKTDFVLEGDIVEMTREVVKELGWEEKMERLMDENMKL